MSGPEQHLDPSDWGAFRALAHRVLDDALSHLEAVRERPVWQGFPAESRDWLRSALPRRGEGFEAAYQQAVEHILPYAIGNTHPRFWGWVRGTGSAEGVVAELITAALNTSAWGGQQAAPWVEAQVLSWLKEALGYPAGASGLLVSGCSMANLVALAAARDRTAGEEVTERGLATQTTRPALYASTETHSSVEKAIGLLGLGRKAIRKVPVDRDFRIDVTVLRRLMAEDRAAGLRPAVVIGNAGTVNTGAVDDLAALAELCAAEGAWFHVDGAFGALAALAPSLRPLLKGMERADSIAFDLHKWLHVPYDCGCVLIRDRAAHEAPFHGSASYLEPLERGAAAGPNDFSRLGPELSRRFRALKVWLLLKAHGADAYGALIEQNCAQARYLAERLRATGVCELLAPVSLNVVCFRYAPADHPEERLDTLNRDLLIALQERGIAVPSATRIHGRFALRVAITNHRSTRADFDALVDGVMWVGKELES
ncbi:MAG TPA: aminotransferase class V-fold PLP-dependent enzyme [Gemmatimonadales bacterium]|nr:aminotransferase class V-fold PLP-dependent enzyme [Gemmatimonadales bacterium]